MRDEVFLEKVALGLQVVKDDFPFAASLFHGGPQAEFITCPAESNERQDAEKSHDDQKTCSNTHLNSPYWKAVFMDGSNSLTIDSVVHSRRHEKNCQGCPWEE